MPAIVTEACLGSIHWGDFPTWVAAVSTGGSLIAAVIVLNLQRRSVADLHAERKRDQARLVSAWCIGKVPMAAVTIQYRNASAQPVYEMTVFVKSGWGTSPSVAQSRLGTIAPDFTTEVTVNAPLDAPPPVPDPSREYPPIVLTFRDASGRWWKRDEHGLLEEWPTEPDVIAEASPVPGA